MMDFANILPGSFAQLLAAAAVAVRLVDSAAAADGLAVMFDVVPEGRVNGVCYSAVS